MTRPDADLTGADLTGTDRIRRARWHNIVHPGHSNEVSSKEVAHMVTAIVLIDVEADRIPEAAQQIADLPGVDQVYSCAGDVDLVAITRVADHEAIAELVPGHISKVPGVLRTVTHIAFREYSQRDAEDAFSIGMQA